MTSEGGPHDLSAYAAVFLAYGGLGVVAFTLLLITLHVNGDLGLLSGVEWLGILIGIFISLYQVFVGIGLEYPAPATRTFVFHFSLYASIALVAGVLYSVYHAATTGESGGVLASLVALPYLAFYSISAWHFHQPDVKQYFTTDAEKEA